MLRMGLKLIRLFLGQSNNCYEDNDFKTLLDEIHKRSHVAVAILQVAIRIDSMKLHSRSSMKIRSDHLENYCNT